MSFSIGSPPIQVHAIADTGSDFIWLQCPCKSCSHHSTKIPIVFEPSESSSYRSLSCDSFGCDAVGAARTCTNPYQTCEYSITYLDGSITKGTFSVDKFAFEDPQRSNNHVDVGSLRFGCSHETSWHVNSTYIGVVGLNRLPLSLISQLNIRKFSYCMVTPDDQGSGSKVYFGSQAVISGGRTPFLEGEDWFYYVMVVGISVGDERVPLPDGVFNRTDSGEGGFVIDSGTTYTMLRSEAYDALIKALGEATPLPQRKGPVYWLELCFEGSFEDLDLAPDVSFQFDGTEIILTKQSTYVEVQEGLWCLSIVRSDRLLSTLGNVQQQNYLVGYDLDEEVVSFAPADCAIF